MSPSRKLYALRMCLLAIEEAAVRHDDCVTFDKLCKLACEYGGRQRLTADEAGEILRARLWDTAKELNDVAKT